MRDTEVYKYHPMSYRASQRRTTPRVLHHCHSHAWQTIVCSDNNNNNNKSSPSGSPHHVVCAFEAEVASLFGMIEEWWWDSYTGPLEDVPKAVARLDVAAVVVHDLW